MQVMFVHQKIATSRRTFPSMNAIAVQCFDDFVGEHGNANQVACPWAVAVPLASATAASSSQRLQLRDLNAHGDISLATLEEEGYKLDVKLERGGCVFSLTALDAQRGLATLAPEDGMATVITFKELLDTKQLHNVRQDTMGEQCLA